MRAENSLASRCWEETERHHGTEKRLREIRRFNRASALIKKGMAIMPICFGVSFNGAFFLNQASALVHIYTDGSVSVATGAVEMGQGVHKKIRQAAARFLSVCPSRVRMESPNTGSIANMSPSSASLAADLNGNAVRLPCRKLSDRMRAFAAEKLGLAPGEDISFMGETVCVGGEPTDLGWEQLVAEMYLSQISLSAHAHYRIPGLHFDKIAEKGRPFAYHVFGTALTEATVDCLHGTYQVDSVSIVHDFGKSLNPLIDQGQVEGGVSQGVGWMITEELAYARDGRLLTDTPLSYKIPDIRSAPREIRVRFLEGSENPLGMFNSKAIGEPPLLYGIGAYFAVLQAMKAFRPELRSEFSAPLTSEKVLMWLHADS